jgi:hypothetical protein
MGIANTAKRYVFWTYERGSMHYDVMVTLILAFIFIAPHFVNFRDKPAAHLKHPNQVIVTRDGQDGFIYEVSAEELSLGADSDVKSELAHALEPLLGEVQIARYEILRNNRGKITAYRIWGRHR